MGAYLDGIPFRVNPQSVSWPFSVKMNTIKTMGGKVAQIYGISLGDLVVSGVFGNGGPEEQQRFFDRLVEIIESQLPVHGGGGSRPVRFHWPERGWDFWCFIKGIRQENASVAISATNADFNPGYVLTMFVQEDNGDIVKVARESGVATYIARLSAGMGWKTSEVYNGPSVSPISDLARGDDSGLLQLITDEFIRSYQATVSRWSWGGADDGGAASRSTGEG